MGNLSFFRLELMDQFFWIPNTASNTVEDVTWLNTGIPVPGPVDTVPTILPSTRSYNNRFKILYTVIEKYVS